MSDGEARYGFCLCGDEGDCLGDAELHAPPVGIVDSSIYRERWVCESEDCGREWDEVFHRVKRVEVRGGA